MILFDGSKKVFKGNLHVHTTCSDGHKTPEEVIELYRSHGYDFLAITDHRKVAVPTQMPDGITVLGGVEFDYNLPGQVIHIVGAGVGESIAAEHNVAFGPQDAIDRINACGGFSILAHPSWSLNTPAIMSGLRNVGGCEIYNTMSGLPWNADRADSSVLLDECFTAGCYFRLVATDDAHFYTGEACRSYTMVAAESREPQDLLAGLRAGNFYASQGPEIKLFERVGDSLHIVCSPVDTICFMSDLPWSGKRVVRGDGLTEATYDLVLKRNERYVRVLLIDKNGNRAWTSPVVL